MKTKRRRLGKSGELETEFIPGEILETYDALAREALGECRTSIAMAARFLNAALWRLPMERRPLVRALSVDGRVLRYDPERVVDKYRENPSELARDCLHSMLHCVFCHPFDRTHDEADTWSLACDIAIELCAMDLCGVRFPSARDRERLEAAKRLRGLVHSYTAPALYRVLRHGGAGEQLYCLSGLSGSDIDELRDLFVRDWHEGWACSGMGVQSSANGAASVPDLQAGGGESEESRAAVLAQDKGNDAEREDDAGQRRSASKASGERDRAEGEGDEANASDEEPIASIPAEPPVEGDGEDAGYNEEADEDALEEWRRVAKQVEAEFRMQLQRGTGGQGDLLQNLSAATRKPADYGSFLSRFATLAEDIRTSDDEFDYVFYTYGLNRYGNMPLVEPLEYVESNRVREFVIALDTSGSCSGQLIRTFVQRTYDLLRNKTSFGDEVNIHIVQCDREVRSATKVSSLRELEGYADSFWASGGGGTDFRPVFSYVNLLVEQGEFDDLRGVVYFTDGYGTFPVRPPDYDVAFVFVDAEGADVSVPPWAMKVVMSQEEILEL